MILDKQTNAVVINEVIRRATMLEFGCEVSWLINWELAGVGLIETTLVTPTAVPLQSQNFNMTKSVGLPTL